MSGCCERKSPSYKKKRGSFAAFVLIRREANRKNCFSELMLADINF